MKQKTVQVLLLTLVCGSLVALLCGLGLLEGLELRSLDVRFRLLAQPERASPDVVLVAIDEKSLKAFKQNNVMWKWPRDFYAALVRYLHRGGAKAICFDILFTDPDVDRLNSDAEETDGAFALAMREAGNVILAAHLDHLEDPLALDNPLGHPGRFRVNPEVSTGPEEYAGRFQSFSSAVLPIALFQEAAAGLGAANYEADAQDGVCRRLPLFVESKGALFPQLGLAACLVSKGIDTVEVLPSGDFGVGNLVVPAAERGRFLINWYGPGGPGGPFAYYSIAPLIVSAIAEESGKEPVLPSSRFRGKVVIVGAIASGLLDVKNTPFSVRGPFPGMDIHATVLSNLLQGDFLRRARLPVPVLAVFAFSFAVSLAFFWLKQVPAVLVVAGLCSAGWLIAALALFRWFDLWLDLVCPELAVLLAFCASAVVSYQTEGKARRLLRASFSRYVSPAVVAEIVDRGKRLELGGRQVTATILFSDIRDFTSISEEMPPQQVVELLNHYFSIATRHILDHEGLLDKYLGDGIMAIFGAPLSNTSHALQACSAALAIQQALELEQRERRPGVPALVTRIGIHTGEAVVGNVGSDLRMEYTAIGDSVNLTSRLEGINKIFSTRILISGSTYEMVKQDFVVRELDVLRVKGKKAPVVCCELVGRVGQVDPSWMRRVNEFRDGLGWYRARAFDKAISVFDSLASSFPEDGPSRVYLARCKSFLESPPPEDWEGVYDVSTK